MHLRSAYIHNRLENYCYRCGNLFGRSRGILYYRPRRRRETPASVARSIFSRLRYAYREFTGYHERSCRKCGRDSTTEWNRRLPGPPPRTLPGRIASLLSGRPVRHRVDLTAYGLPGAPAKTPFPAYGLVGRPLGLELRSMSWETRRSGSSARRIGLLYEAQGERPPWRRLLLEQAADGEETGRMWSPEQELRAIVEVVQQHGARGQRGSYADRGNVFRHWNLARLAAARRRTLEMHVGCAPARVEIAQWSDAQQVVVARLRLRGAEAMAAAVDVSPARLMAMLKGLRPLRCDAKMPP